jgi:Dolichyl-phosphate-mannose-protein mannosyltransferase
VSGLAKVADGAPKIEEHGSVHRPLSSIASRLAAWVTIFAGVWLILFLVNTRYVFTYDEGIALTAVMRTMAGQVLHRDFYYIYGPAQLYILAGLFKAFGPSVMVARLAAGFSASCLVLSIYGLTRKFCSRGVSLAAALLCLIWILGLIIEFSFMNSTIPVLTLWGCWFTVPSDEGALQQRRSAAAGLMGGMLFLFRYDMGIGLAAANLFAAAVIEWMRGGTLRQKLHWFATRIFWPYVAGFAILVIPAAIAYLSVAPVHPLLYDIVLYPAKYYGMARRLPLPKFRIGLGFEDVVIYFLPIIMALSLWLGIRMALASERADRREHGERTPGWVNVLIVFGIASAVMYLKGFVRISAGQVGTSTVVCLVMAAILFEHRRGMAIWARVPFFAAVIMLFATASWAADGWLLAGTHLRPLVVNWLVTPNRQPPDAPFRSWCRFGTPITRGVCFLTETDRMQVVEYLDTHTKPGDTLYVGLAHHDRIYINDNITYFATQRLPATKWSHFDPFLQNRADIQSEMIADLERNKPPYVVLDTEFEQAHEPNGSSVSTGVHLLDDYLQSHYSFAMRFGAMTILKRND